jgi:hypothetical protein
MGSLHGRIPRGGVGKRDGARLEPGGEWFTRVVHDDPR